MADRPCHAPVSCASDHVSCSAFHFQPRVLQFCAAVPRYRFYSAVYAAVFTLVLRASAICPPNERSAAYGYSSSSLVTISTVEEGWPCILMY